MLKDEIEKKIKKLHEKTTRVNHDPIHEAEITL